MKYLRNVKNASQYASTHYDVLYYASDIDKVLVEPFADILVTYNVTDISSATTLFKTFGSQSYLTDMTIDGGDWISTASTYQFDTVGLHVVGYKVDTSVETAAPLFYQQSEIVKAEIRKTVKDMWFYGFFGCTNLKHVYIGACVEKISSSAFEECSSLETVILNEGLVTIDEWAFYSVSSLKNISLPSSLKIIGKGAFDFCDKVDFQLGTNIEYIGEWAFDSCSGITKVVIPSSVTTLGRNAFSDCCNVKEVVINSTVDIPIQFMFDDDSHNNLKKISLQDGLTKIGEGAFYQQCGLTSVTIPNSVTIIDVQAFNRCNNIQYIKLSDNVTELRHSCFNRNYALKQVDYKGVSYFKRSLLEAALTANGVTIGQDAFDESSASFDDM